MTLLETTYQIIKRQNIDLSDTRLVVGVSGGADSLALLHILHQLAPRLGYQLHVATLDHGLRGTESADDVRFVIETCRTWDIPITTGQVDTASLAQQQQTGIEAAARSARYTFLAQTAHQQNACCIVVAHHADDQAETILMHLIRGSGLQGLSGMKIMTPLPADPSLTLLRPFLPITRAEIESYCRQHQLAARADSTNKDTAYTRNQLRLQTLPHLRQLNPHIERALLQLADIADVESDYIQQQLNQVIANFVTITPSRISIERSQFHTLHPALQRRLVYWAAQQFGSSTGYQHVTAAISVVQTGQQGAIALLPDHVQLRVDYGKLVIESQDAPLTYAGPLLPPGFDADISAPGVIALPGWELHIQYHSPETSEPVLTLPTREHIRLRTRQPGDRFQPQGLQGHSQKLKKWLIDHKIPRSIRSQIPLLVVKNEIAAFYIHKEWMVSQTYALKTIHQANVYFHFTNAPKVASYE